MSKLSSDKNRIDHAENDDDADDESDRGSLSKLDAATGGALAGVGEFVIKVEDNTATKEGSFAGMNNLVSADENAREAIAAAK